MPHMLVAINWLIVKEVCIERQSKKTKKTNNLIVASSAIQFRDFVTAANFQLLL